MKRLLTFSFTFAVVFYVLSGFQGCGGNYATQQDLDALEQRLKNEILQNRDQILITQQKVDQVQRQVQILQTNQDTIKNNLNELKNGQAVIYTAIKNMDNSPKAAKQEFLNKLQKYLGL